jgi:hypothetical protein
LSTSWLRDVEPIPRILVLPPGGVDLGEAAAAIELWQHYSGKILDPAQVLAVQVMMAQGPDGRWAAMTTGREMPRQNGKGDEIEVVELWGLVQRSEAILHTVHDAVLLASQTQQRMLGVLEGHADLRRKVKRKWQGTGQQMIEMHNGGIIWYRTRTGGGGRGVDDIDRLVVDEAQHASEEHLAAVSPTLLANDNPQLNALGTAALSGVSGWWWRFRKRALSDDPGSFGYVGHSAETVSLDEDGRVVQETIDVTDRRLWIEANPALASGRGGGEAFLEEQLRRLGPDSFAREHLGVWDPPDDEDGIAAVLDPELWMALEDKPTDRPTPVTLTVTTNLDRTWSHICLAGRRPDGLTHLQVAKSNRGTHWVVDEVARMVKEWKPVSTVVPSDDPAASLIPDLESAGVTVRALNRIEYARACGMFVDAVAPAEGLPTVRHGGGQQVTVSLGAARWQNVGGTRAFGPPKNGGIDIAPLKGVACALYALADAPAPKRRTGLVVGLR